MIGQCLRERYRIVAKIGQGGMGIVFLAEDERLAGRRVAVKQLQPTGPLSEEAVGQLRHEAEVLAKLDHPALPAVLDFFALDEPTGGVALVMEFVPGQDLGEIVKEARRKGRTLPEAQVLRWAEALCDVLTYLHLQEPPLLHRDVKPGNVKLAPDGTLKLVDFGIAMTMGEGEEERTMSGPKALGTLPYLPLEQYGADLSGNDPRADLYALGATLYHLFTGQQPLSAQERFLQPSRFEPPSALVPTLAPHVERAVLRAMALKPQERPASVEAFRAELLRGEGPTPSRPIPWLAALRANADLLAVALLLLTLALFITLR